MTVRLAEVLAVAVALAAGASSASCRAAPAGSGPGAAPGSGSASAAAAATVAAGAASSADARAPIDAGAPVDAGASAGARVCFPPLSGDFDRCPKGAMKGDDGLRACRERQAAAGPRHPVFTVGAARPSAFSPTRWRCVPIPIDAKVHVTVDTIAGVDVSVPPACASHTLDMIGPNGYGAVFFRCSTRTGANDEVLGADAADAGERR